MKRSLLLAVVVMLASMSAVAQTGTLTVSATVTGSIALAFNTDVAGLALTSGAGTSAATLAFGSIQAFGGVVPGTVLRTVGATNFTVSTPVDVKVTTYNSASPNYTLKAQLQAADLTNTWTVGGTAVTGGAQALIAAAGLYSGSGIQAVALTVPFASATGTLINNAINFTATAN